MVKHIVLWCYKDEISPEERQAHSARIKADLEALAGVIDGIVEIRVAAAPLAGSNVDIALDSSFVSEEALAAYVVHPAHKKVGEMLRPLMQERRCVDYAL